MMSPQIPASSSPLHVSFFLQFLFPPFIACIELVSLGSEAIYDVGDLFLKPIITYSHMISNLIQQLIL